VLQQEAKRVLGIKLVEVANQISGLEVRAAKIAQAESSLNQQIKQLPNLARQYTDLQRELKIATQSLNQFLEKRESLQIENAQKQIPWQLLSTPELPQTPFSPNVQRNLILGVITGLLAGMAAALLVERLDNVFHSSDELKEITKLPLLGMIPFHKHLKQLPTVAEANVEPQADSGNLVFRNISNVQGYSYFPFLEAFRSLHTNISFLGSDTPIHSLVISSSIHAEGKSTVALNLAQAAAAMGQRVLLVDADLRLPQMHTLLGLPNEQGLSNVISTNLPVLEVIQQSPFSDNLFVLTSGQIPPDPTKLLSSKKMQNIMQQLRQNFDLVIYDTPPLLGLADSSLLATYTAGIVLVVRMGKTDRSILMQSLDRIKISRAPILGTVCNGVKNNKTTAYNYYYRPRTQSAGAN
jgi:capsular exopolysaccharide synthesis family protein